MLVLMMASVVFVTPARATSGPAAGGGDENGEIWITNQDGGQLFIVHPRAVLHGASIETIVLPTGTRPHITTFSPDGAFAYVADLGMGNLIVVRANDRQIVTILSIGMSGTHQAKPSPDGSLLLVANMHDKTLTKVSADEAAESWNILGSMSLAKPPICTVFRNDGLRAYVSLLPSGIAIVDVSTMTLLGTLPTDGFIACGMTKSHDGQTVFIASTGGGDTLCNPMTGVGTCPGHLYRLDTTTDTLTDLGSLDAASWHSFSVLPDERTAIGSSPAADQVEVIDLATSTAFPLDLNPTPGANNDRPDGIGVQGNNVYVSLRAAGKLAIINMARLTVDYIDLAPPSPFAIHGVAVRP